ncbi:HTH domain-containing protein [Marivivens sp. LCG002]|uniref:helix-turn-helix transcriptional regulator n=1 Tax=Marivivens sp. LCG002 TaxID=3051171 RepID=UPI00331E6100
MCNSRKTQMKRKERLAKLTALLRSDDQHQGEALAAQLGVSLRTLYRDMDTLAASGVSVQGERGKGYRVNRAIDLPPLQLSDLEMEALQLGLAAVSQSNDRDLAEAARALGRKLDAHLSEVENAPRLTELPQGFAHLTTIRHAIRARQKLLLTLDGAPRTLRPLALEYWGRIWLVQGWCETTRGFAEYPIGEISALRVLPGLFVEEAGKTLGDLRRAL